MKITLEIDDSLVERLKTLHSDIDILGNVCYTEYHNGDLTNLVNAGLLKLDEFGAEFYLTDIGRGALQQAGGKE